MKFLKQFGVLLLFIVIVTAVLSLVLPTRQTIERTTTINAPANIVYDYLTKLENFNQVTVWNKRDSTVKYSKTGTDGTTGAAFAWDGDIAISGKGKMTITALEPNKKITHALEFTYPKKGSANSVFLLNEANGTTTVTWTFEMNTPRPWNIFNLFYSMDEEMGGDFDEGLVRLKKTMEPADATVAAPPVAEIKPMNFPDATYAIIRQRIKWDDIGSFYAQHLSVLNTEAGDKVVATPGLPVSLVYEWDEKTREADYAVGLPVPAGTKVNNSLIQVIDIPASKSVYLEYDGTLPTNELYAVVRKYLKENKLDELTPIIEYKYATPGPKTGRVIFLVD
jgi:uncharacterized protein YndB with AHSA1/START domain